MTEYTKPDISTENVARMIEGVTPAPWEADYTDPSDVVVWSPGDKFLTNIGHSYQRVDVAFDCDIANARFIAWAREAVPAMAEALKAAEAENRKLRDALRLYADVCDTEDPENCKYSAESCCYAARKALGMAFECDLKMKEASDE